MNRTDAAQLYRFFEEGMGGLPSSSSSGIKHRGKVPSGVHIAELSPPPWSLFRLQIISFALQENIFQDIAQRENAHQTVVLVDDHKSMDSRFPDRIKDGVEAVIDGTCVYSREILRRRLALAPQTE